mgnify:CR=1 FL=1
MKSVFDVEPEYQHAFASVVGFIQRHRKADHHLETGGGGIVANRRNPHVALSLNASVGFKGDFLNLGLVALPVV